MFFFPCGFVTTTASNLQQQMSLAAKHSAGKRAPLYTRRNQEKLVSCKNNINTAPLNTDIEFNLM